MQIDQSRVNVSRPSRRACFLRMVPEAARTMEHDEPMASCAPSSVQIKSRSGARIEVIVPPPRVGRPFQDHCEVLRLAAIRKEKTRLAAREGRVRRGDRTRTVRKTPDAVLSPYRHGIGQGRAAAAAFVLAADADSVTVRALKSGTLNGRWGFPVPYKQTSSESSH